MKMCCLLFCFYSKFSLSMSIADRLLDDSAVELLIAFIEFYFMEPKLGENSV